jgi:hypothetical protein
MVMLADGEESNDAFRFDHAIYHGGKTSRQI